MPELEYDNWDNYSDEEKHIFDVRNYLYGIINDWNLWRSFFYDDMNVRELFKREIPRFAFWLYYAFPHFIYIKMFNLLDEKGAKSYRTLLGKQFRRKYSPSDVEALTAVLDRLIDASSKIKIYRDSLSAHYDRMVASGHTEIEQITLGDIQAFIDIACELQHSIELLCLKQEDVRTLGDYTDNNAGTELISAICDAYKFGKMYDRYFLYPDKYGIDTSRMTIEELTSRMHEDFLTDPLKDLLN